MLKRPRSSSGLLAGFVLVVMLASACQPTADDGTTASDPAPSSPTASTVSPGAADSDAFSEAGSTSAAAATAGGRKYGVLIADPRNMDADYHAGIRLAVRSLSWKKWQPSSTGFDAKYRQQEIDTVNQFRAKGFTVAIDLGLHYAPDWVLAGPEARLRDQNFNRSSVANFMFSAAVRRQAVAYINDVVKSLGSLAYVKIGLSASGEALYPKPVGDGWWGFDEIAQGKQAGLPVGVPVTPMPGWIPGQGLWNGQAVTTAQVTAWYRWYQGALADALDWEMDSLRNAGYTGSFKVAVPGNGANPWVYANRIKGNLAPQSYDAYRTMNSGAAYHELLDRLKPRTGVALDITSVGDHSGTPADNVCQATDDAVDYRTEPSVDKWSSTRWLSYLARRHGLPVYGESTGENSKAEMETVFRLVKACNLSGLLWAFDYQLHAGTYATIGDYEFFIQSAG